MTKQYKNKFDRAMQDENWEGNDDGYEYSSAPIKRFRRNKIDGVLGGVCSGIGDYFNIDPVIVRIIFIILLLSGVSGILYFLIWIFTPSDKRAPYVREKRRGRNAKHKAKRSDRLGEAAPARRASFRDVKGKFRSLEMRLQDLERSITSSEWQLRREFRDLES